jgi:hypothetical protein
MAGQAARLPAIVLSCDRFHPFTAHMIRCYDALWPSHPLRFHVPYQESAYCGTSVEPRRTRAPIRSTVLDLLEEFDDEAWVYWCIDDRYPVRFAQPSVARIAEAVVHDRLPGIDGILCCRCRRMLLPEFLTGERREGPGGVMLLRRREYSQIWIHQFLRVKVLRHLFLPLPDLTGDNSALDLLKHKIALPGDHRIYVVETNLAVFGESTSGGRVTRNCAASLRAQGLGIPAGFAESDAAPVILGSLD